jgi:hypothetical protein
MHAKLCRAPGLYVIWWSERGSIKPYLLIYQPIASRQRKPDFKPVRSFYLPPFLSSRFTAYFSLFLWRRQISWSSPQPPFTHSTHSTHPLPPPPSPLHRLPQASPNPQRILNEVLPKPPWRYTLCMTTVHLGLTTGPCKTCQEPPNLHTTVLAILAVHQAHITLRLRKASGLVTLVQLPGLQQFRERAAHRPRTQAHPTLASKKTSPLTTITYCVSNRFQSLPVVAGPPISILTAPTKHHHNRDTSAPVPLKVDPPQHDLMHPQD